MWEYGTVVVQVGKFGTLKDVLSEWGKQGWEAVGMCQTNWDNGPYGANPTIGVLLKRRSDVVRPVDVKR